MRKHTRMQRVTKRGKVEKKAREQQQQQQHRTEKSMCHEFHSIFFRVFSI